MQTGNYRKAVIRYTRNRSCIKTNGSQEKPHIKGVFPSEGHHSPAQYGEKCSKLRKLPIQVQRGRKMLGSWVHKIAQYRR